MHFRFELIPPIADPTRITVRPVGTLLDVVVAEDPGQNNVVHVAGHRVLGEQLVGYLVDAHEG